MSKKTMLQRRAAQAAKRGQIIAPSADNTPISMARYADANYMALVSIARAHSEGRARGVYKGAIDPCATPSKRYELQAPANHYYPSQRVTAWRDIKRD